MLRKFGFTLIELMVVLAVVGILSAVAFPVYNKYLARSSIMKVVDVVLPYQQAVQLYYQLNGVAPTTTAQLNLSGTANVINIGSGQLPLSNIISQIIFATNGNDPTINFYIPVANLGLAPVGGVSTIILTYNLSNNLATNLLQWTCSFTQGGVEFSNLIPRGCT